MHIKQLEIQGFKSFVDRTLIPFDHDIIGIVGPNGCGKSNVVDAIRWCMGEQSAKHLRGRSMADVIFNGSESRGPHGFAEVTLTFDNADPEGARSLPIEYRDYPEIAVTRRLFRDGTSEYLVNKTQVRLKDLTDLFLGTGVGSKAYSIVEQGKIGLIISARPEDRRVLIEEAAGITKYKHRRRQAEQKMDLTRQNLSRVGDLISEIERGLAALKRQAAKAERYKAYRAELEDLVLHEATHRFLEHTVVGRVHADALAEAGEALDRSKIELAAHEAQLEASRQGVYALEARVDKAQNESFAATNEARALEAELARARDKLVSLRERETQAGAERDELRAQVRGLDDERTFLSDRLASSDHGEREETELAEAAAERLEALREHERTAEGALAGLRARATEAAARVAGAEAKLEGFARRLRDVQGRRERITLEEDSLRVARDDLDARRNDLASELGVLTETRRGASEARLRRDEELKGLREAVTIDQRTLEVAKNDLSQKRNRLRALEEVHRRREGIGAGAKHLLASGAPWLRGLVAERIEAPRELTPALAGLLGERLQDVVTSDLSAAASTLSEMAKQRRGRAAVVAERPAFVAGTAPRLTGEGVIGPLVERLRYAPADEALVHALVGGAVVVRGVDDALRLAPHTRGRALVTLDGTTVDPSGRVVGGTGDAIGAGLLDQSREMRELSNEVATLSADVEARVADFAELQRRTNETQHALDTARTEAHRAEVEHVTVDKDLRRAEEQYLAAVRRLDAIASERDELDDRLAEAADEESDAREALSSGRTSLDELRTALADAETGAALARERSSAQQSVVTEHKVRLARLREQTESVRATVERLARSVEELGGRAERLERELADNARLFGATAAAVVVGREGRGRADLAARAADEALTNARRDFDQARSELALRESSLKDLRARVAELSERRAHHGIEAQRVSLALEHLLAGVAERFRGLDLRRVVGDYHARPFVDDAHRARINELGQLIDRMGPVNLDAVREHAEAQGRFEYYASQRADLDGALADLEKAIAQMDRESRRLFRETFDSVNEKFQVTFPRMFRGGAARLQLTNPEDLLETGLEILAQPPGKKVSNIELMSGGEKALTAVALLFAMFQHKPSPFCILDEVDAPLDEANVTRYNEAVRSMTDKSQFILITHIKRTMQSVDVLFGVTMQEPGVSKLVAVKINDTAPRRGRPTEGDQSAVA